MCSKFSDGSPTEFSSALSSRDRSVSGLEIGIARKARHSSMHYGSVCIFAVKAICR